MKLIFLIPFVIATLCSFFIARSIFHDLVEPITISDYILTGGISFLCWIVILLIAGLVSSSIYEQIDIKGQPVLHTKGTCVEKSYSKPSTSPMIIGSVIVPNSHPATYKLQIQFNSEPNVTSQSEFSASKDLYNSISENDSVGVEYCIGKSGDVYVIEVSKE